MFLAPRRLLAVALAALLMLTACSTDKPAGGQAKKKVDPLTAALQGRRTADPISVTFTQRGYRSVVTLSRSTNDGEIDMTEHGQRQVIRRVGKRVFFSANQPFWSDFLPQTAKQYAGAYSLVWLEIPTSSPLEVLTEGFDPASSLDGAYPGGALEPAGRTTLDGEKVLVYRSPVGVAYVRERDSVLVKAKNLTDHVTYEYDYEPDPLRVPAKSFTPQQREARA